MIYTGEDAKQVAMIVTHLQYNAGKPTALARVAKDAIDIANTYSYQYDPAFKEPEFPLPAGISYRGQTSVKVSDLIEWLRLEWFLVDVMEGAN